MRKYILLLALMLALVPLIADQAWQQAIQVRGFDNVSYSGQSVFTHDGYHFLMWKENHGGAMKYCCQLYDQDFQPQWQEDMFLFLNISYLVNIYDLIETSDSSFVILYFNYGVRALKITREGALPWGDEGISIYHQTLQGLSMAADLNGGLYLAWAGSGNDHRPVTIQHLGSDGSLSMASGGVSLDNAISYRASLLIRPDNSVLVAWGVEQSLRANIVNSSGQLLWNQHIDIPSQNQYPGVGLCAFEDSSFALCVEDYNHLDIHRFNSSGEALWQQPVTTINEYSLNALSLKLKLASDNSILIMVKSQYGHHLQKVSADGLLQYPASINLQDWVGYIDRYSDIIPLADGACAVVLTSSLESIPEKELHAVKIDGSGTVSVHPITNTNDKTSTCTAHIFEGDIHVVWQRWTKEESGIYAQKLDADLLTTQIPGGLPLRFGSNGVVNRTQIAATQTGCAVAWEQAPSHYNRWQYRLQYYSNQGQPLYGAEGLRINQPGSLLTGIQKIISNGTDLLLIWGEQTDGISSTRMQIINADGELLLGAGGMEVSTDSSTAGAESLYATSHQGDWYLLWVSGGNVMGQKIRGTQALWGNGRQLTVSHPQYGGNVSGCSLTMPWLFWKVNGNQFCKRIDTEGVTQPGFPEYGKFLAMQPPGSPWVEGTSALTVCGDKLHMFKRYSYTTGPPEYTERQCRHTFFGPDAEPLFAPAIVDDASYFSYKNNELWMTGYMRNDYYIRKYDTLGNELSNQSIQLDGLPFFFDWATSWDFLSSENEHLVLVSGTSIFHFYITPEMEPQVPADYMIHSGTVSNYPTVAFRDDSVWLSFKDGADPNTNYNIGIKMQKLVRIPPSNPDDTLPPANMLRFTSCSPNPFNPHVNISFNIPKPGDAKLAVYDLRGRKTRILVDNFLTAAEHQIMWDGKDDAGRDVASGVYILQLESGGKSSSRKISLLK
ncbi:MAG: T9SS type A sorting domain-containing protein [Candidatus Cloacimonadaceae bacterium]